MNLFCLTCSSSWSPYGPMSLPWKLAPVGVSSSSETILKLALGVEPGWVEIIPLNRVTHQDLTWLYSEHTDTRYFSDRATLVTGDLDRSFFIMKIIKISG